MANDLQPTEQKHKFSIMLTQPKYQNLINNTLKDPVRANNFIANISTVVATNPALQECETSTILAAAFLAESLHLSMSPQLGYCYLVPYDTAVKGPDGKIMWITDPNTGRNIKKTVKKAQFQMGYKGYIQLAIRSGQYKKLIVLPIKEGELKKFYPLEEVIDVNLIEDDIEREKAETIGYYAMFEYHTGFRKAIYWSKEKMMAHADKYSAAFSAAAYTKIQNGEISEKDMWRYSSFWYKDFDAMAMKTMLRQIISKWGVVSIEMENVINKDMAVINDDGSYDYVDNSSEPESIPPPDEIIVQDEPYEENEVMPPDDVPEEMNLDDI